MIGFAKGKTHVSGAGLPLRHSALALAGRNRHP